MQQCPVYWMISANELDTHIKCVLSIGLIIADMRAH